MIGLVLALTLIARCEPSHVVRGEQVTCTARLDPPGPFLLLEKKAVARGRTLVDPSRARFETGGEVHWSGPAVLDTEVSLDLRPGDGTALAARTGFTVEPRRWPPLLLPGVVAPWDYGEDEIFGG
ncbi:MAG: hypothetical protein ACJ783_11690, partial [Myxococcales bacterium]